MVLFLENNHWAPSLCDSSDAGPVQEHPTLDLKQLSEVTRLRVASPKPPRYSHSIRPQTRASNTDRPAAAGLLQQQVLFLSAFVLF